jgi:hypothetical protein
MPHYIRIVYPSLVIPPLLTLRVRLNLSQFSEVNYVVVTAMSLVMQIIP